jgi:hypothetical protein
VTCSYTINYQSLIMRFTAVTLASMALISSASAISCNPITSFTIKKRNNCIDSWPCSGGACGGVACTEIVVKHNDGKADGAKG